MQGAKKNKNKVLGEAGGRSRKKEKEILYNTKNN
jgi:hypothetical protein